MLSFSDVFSAISTVIAIVAIIFSTKTFFIQKLTYTKSFAEVNVFDVDCKGILISNVATSDNTDDSKEVGETTRLPDGGFLVNVKDVLILEFILVFTTAGRCCLVDSDISEIRLESNFNKVKVTGFTSASVVDNINGFASNGFTLKTMKFQYIMPKSWLLNDVTFTKVVIESKKIKNGSAVFSISTNMKDIISDQANKGVFIGVYQKIS